MDASIETEQWEMGMPPPPVREPPPMQMMSLSKMKVPYEAAMSEDWKGMKKYYEKNAESNLLLPLTVANDTAFHLAVYSKSDQPLSNFLELVGEDFKEELLVFTTNACGNTILHEAAANGNFKAAKLLMPYSNYDQLVESRNKFGETPLFMAAAFGSRKTVKLLGSRPEILDDNKRLKDIHRRKDGNISILHVAIRGQHFGTALELLNLDESLAEEDRGMTSLQLLANMPSAFESGYHEDAWTSFLYFCLPVGAVHNKPADGIDDDGDDEETFKAGDPESGQNKTKNNPRFRYLNLRKISTWIDVSIKRFFFRGWPRLKKIREIKIFKIWEIKRKHKLAIELAKKLIEKDNSWALTTVYDTTSSFRPTEDHNSEADQGAREVQEGESKSSNIETPLLVATKNGIVEIVDEILRVHPQAVEHCGHMKQNILHVAVKHRQNEIFRRVKKMKVAMAKLVRGIDHDGYSILHSAADTEHYIGGARAGPAYELQEELKWFKRVQKIVPFQYAMHHDKKHNMTARELFKEKHRKQLEVAQTWIKETSQSCSAVAVLVATVVFAAAYTVPGGSNEHGLPIFLEEPLFVFFTVMDIVGLASSLTSVVMFLSILTSPFQLHDFLDSLPRKLTLGFSLLSLSVASTMLAFAATILLIIHFEKRWTTTLIYTAAFFPVGALAITQFPVAFGEPLKKFFGLIRTFLRIFSRFVIL